MKSKFAIFLGLAVLLTSGQRVFSADAATELKALVDKIRTEVAAGKKTESDLAYEVKQFDVLLAEHQGDKTDAVARILYMKATLYGEVFQDQAKADALIKQLKTEFKDTEFVAALEK